MHVRVVRFTGSSAERLSQILEQVREGGGPPPGVNSRRLQFLLDESQGTVLAIQYFDSAEDMHAGASVLGAMDASETPGTRVSVDECELKLDLQA
jgi:hypothetical protein